MAKINFNLKTPNEEKSPIVLRYYLKKGRLIQYTGITIPTRFWNPKLQSIRKSDEYPEGQDQQLRLEDIETAVKAVERSFLHKKEIPSVHSFKIALAKELNPDQENSVLAYINTFINERKQDRRYRPESIKVYETLRKHFKTYIGNPKLDFADLDKKLLEGFVNYLFRKKYSDNHVNKMLGTLKTIINHADSNGINVNLAGKKVSVGKKEADNIYLDNDDINSIYTLELTGLLDETRDLFIIGCYTGLRYSDYSRLSRNNLVKLSTGRYAFRLVTFKTKQRLVIPLHPTVIEILEKYDYVLPKGCSNQRMNKHLKDIAELAGLNTLYEKRIFRAGDVEIITKKRYQLVCTHTARRSFASNAYKAKIPVPSIMGITGHKKTETFMKYISLSEEEHAELMSENPFFNPD